MIIDSTGMSPDCADWRHITNGKTIPIGVVVGGHYVDQPYIVVTSEGDLVCLATTGAGHEGSSGQHVTAIRSTDGGQSWGEPVALETPDGPEASYAVGLRSEAGRIFAFYNHNTDAIQRVPFEDPNCRDAAGGDDGYCYRVDSLGYFVFRFSDDGGRTWSKERYPVDVREMEMDRTNTQKGEVRYFWNVGKAFSHNGVAYVPLHKVGGFGYGFFIRSEGVLLKSSDLFQSEDPVGASFETLPDGDFGIRAPEGAGPIAEEHSFSVLSDGSFFVVYRTISGHPACSYSDDDGRTWEEPDFMRYRDGRPMKNPRAANFCWRHSSGKYLYWFSNHGGTGYEDRNPVWVCAGREVNRGGRMRLEFGEPEILLYDDDPFLRMSYPDLFEWNGRTFVTETDKRIARIHEIDEGFLQKIFSGLDEKDEVLPKGPVVDWNCDRELSMAEIDLPAFQPICFRQSGWSGIYSTDSRRGYTLDFEVDIKCCESGTVLFDSMDEGDGGFRVVVDDGRVAFYQGDGRTVDSWRSSPFLKSEEGSSRFTIIVDGGPKTISFVINGAFDDGGEDRQFGFGLFNCHLRAPNGRERATVGKPVRRLRIFDRALLTCEAVGLHRAEMPAVLESNG